MDTAPEVDMVREASSWLEQDCSSVVLVVVVTVIFPPFIHIH